MILNNFFCPGFRLTTVTLLLVAFAGLQQVAADEPSYDPSYESDSVRPDSQSDRDLARKTLERWQATIQKNQKHFFAVHPVLRDYHDVWATIDLDRAIEIHQSMDSSIRLPSYEIRLLERLAAVGRWDDVERIAGQMEKKNQYRLARFWGVVAEYGVAQQDADIVDLAGRHIEAAASQTVRNPARAPEHSLDVRGGRFFVAAARLELLRNKPASPEQEQQVIQAINDLWRAAGSFGPYSTMFSFYGSHSVQCPAYASLESWRSAHPDNFNTQTLRKDKDLQPLIEIVDRGYQWPDLELPELGDYIVQGWVHRQLDQGRGAVALAYLARAQGKPLDRARLLAVAARSLAASNPKLADVCRSVAETLIERHDSLLSKSRFWTRMEACAELALAYEAADQNQKALQWINTAIQGVQFVNPDQEIEYNALNAIADAAGVLNLDRNEIPAGITNFTVGFDRETAKSYSLYVRGVRRYSDIRNLVEFQVVARHPQHVKYYRMVEQRDWAAAVTEIERLATGNSAWNSSLSEIGDKSFRDIGLKQTLEWTATIKDDRTRIAVELGAIATAIEADRKSLRQFRDMTSPKTIAPLIGWPGNGC